MTSKPAFAITPPATPTTSSPIPLAYDANIQPPSVLLMGGTGSGKTYSLSTIAEAGFNLVVLITEPTGLDSLLDAFERKNIPLDRLAYRQITPSRSGFAKLISMGQKISMMDQEGLSKLKPGPGREKARWIDALRTMENFVDERTGKVLGDVTELPANHAFVVDSLSGLSLMAWDMVVGDKPTASPGEWAIAMNQIEKLLNQLTSDSKCMFVLTAHMEREVDEISGAQRIMTSTLGRKLAPKIPRFFSEVVMPYRENTEFFWSTSNNMADLKNRALPLSSKLPPTFRPIIDTYLKRVQMLKAPAIS